MMKYATAIRVGTASTEAILRRFTHNATHPTYRAMLEVGRAEKTIFLARYLRDRDLQQDTEGGLTSSSSAHRGRAFGGGAVLRASSSSRTCPDDHTSTSRGMGARHKPRSPRYRIRGWSRARRASRACSPALADGRVPLPDTRRR